jgi:glycosyltransferase involved in cell wall biosynthesis
VKIVQVVGWYFPDSIGGTEVYVAALARRFRAAGHHVLIAAPDPGGAGVRTYEVDETPVYRYPTPLAITRDEAQGRTSTRGTGAFHEWLAAQRPDVVHAHTFVTGLGLPELAAARRAGARVIVTTHSSSLGFLCQRGTLMWHGDTLCDGIVDRVRCAECELEHRGAGPVVSTLLARMPHAVGAAVRVLPGKPGTALAMAELIDHNLARQRELFELADMFVVLTRRAADIVVANGAPTSKVAVNRLGISQDAAALPPRAARNGGRVRVGYVGRYDPIKGVHDLADAVKRLPIDLPIDVEFRGPSTAEPDRGVRELLQRTLGGDRRVRFGEVVAADDVLGVLGGYDVICCPSRCLEGGPTVGLEALAAGTPVIAANAGGVAEVIEDGVNGRLVPVGDVAALSRALAEVADDPARTIDRWRAHLPRPRTMSEVAADYLTLYAAAR